MFTIIGLGNPGEEYENTRHNTGRMAVDAFRVANDFSDWKEDGKTALVSKGKIAGSPVVLNLPQTFMNKSGEAVGKIKDLRFKSVGKGKDKRTEIGNLIVVHDDLDIPFGKFKISFNKSSGGHRGVESIVKALKTEAFIRVRVGISPATAKGVVKKPKGEEAVGKFILGKFKNSELADFKKISKTVAEAVKTIIAESLEKAMGLYNSR